MLQIVPSKNNHERLLLISPELASVLATIIMRLRAHNSGTVAADRSLRLRTNAPRARCCRTCSNVESAWRVGSPERRHGPLADRADPAARRGRSTRPGNRCGSPRTTSGGCSPPKPAASGLPIHIVARLLGHANINTSQTYTAVFKTT